MPEFKTYTNRGWDFEKKTYNHWTHLSHIEDYLREIKLQAGVYGAILAFGERNGTKEGSPVEAVQKMFQQLYYTHINHPSETSKNILNKEKVCIWLLSFTSQSYWIECATKDKNKIIKQLKLKEGK